jgi:trans-aconitate methyltransferase
MSAQQWNAQEYAQHGRFVADLAGDVLALLRPLAGERILDLGCGDGVPTAAIAASGASVLGVDSSPAMVKAAQARGVKAQVVSAEALPFDGEFDAVFSNAALHWMRDQDAVLRGVARALRPGGRFVAEMGGHGNIAAIRVALLAVLEPRGLSRETIEQNVFFTPEEYRSLLEQHGFEVEQIALIPRPTPLPSGMRHWLMTFRGTLLGSLGDAERERLLDELEAVLRPVLADGEGNWFADYARLRFVARKRGGQARAG